MTKKHIGTRVLDVFAHAPGSLKESLYSLPVNVLILCLILCRCVSVGYFVMGLVWKLHTDVIDESWIRILNRLWIGNLRLGSTVNGLVFTAICLFPVYGIAGTLGLVGVFCKKKICIVLYMIFLLLFIVIDIVYVSLFAVLLTNMKSSSLASDFQGLYSSFVGLNGQTDVKNIRTDWLQMFQLLGCCGITNNGGDIHCYHYFPKHVCWEKFSDAMTTYCSSYVGLAGLLFFLEIIQLSLCDLIYSHLSGEKKLPFAIAKTFLSKMQISWRTSRKTVLTNICRALSSIPAIALIILGSVLLYDEQMTGEYVYHIYIRLYFCGLNFTDIINGLGNLMIVLGTLELFANVSAVIADVKFPVNKTKSAMFLVLDSLLMVLKIIVLSLCIQLVLQMNDDEPRKQMAYLLRNHSMDNMKRNWMYLFSELQCCGLISGYDISDFIITISRGHYPITCCRTTLYDLTNSQISSNNDIDGQYCNLIQKGCLEKLTEIFQIYTTGFLVTTSMSIIFGSMVIVFTTAQLKSIYSTNLKKAGIPEDNVVDRNYIGKRLITYCKMNWEHVIPMIATILCIIFGSALLIEGFLFKYDYIFNHHIIKEVLFNNITFEGLSFTDIRQSQCSFMFASGTVLVIFCGSGIFMLKTKSKYLYIIQMVFVSLVLALTIIGIGLWGKIKDSISNQLETETKYFLYRFGYVSVRQFAHLHTSEGALNNLFAMAECCGLTFSDGREFSLGGGDKIPIFCCKSNPLTEPSLFSNDNCTQKLESSLRHTVACNDAILTRLDYYDTSFFCFTSLTILCLVIQISFYIYRLCKRNFTPFEKEKYFNLLKSQGGYRLSVVFEWRTLFLFLVMISSVTMVVFGVLLKHDDKMTGDSVQHLYQFLYFHGANFNDIVEAMYLSLIVLGVSSLVCCMLGLSDIFKLLRHTVKEKIYIAVLFILIPAKLICVFLLESIHSEIDTYSNSTNYQFLNMDRQFSNRHSSLYIHLNNFYRQFDCCGSTGSQGFRDLVSNAGYGSVSGYQPYVCCHDYTQTNSLYHLHCEKRACGGEFLSSVNYYSYGLMASMSITAVFEIICLIFSMYYLLRFKKQEQSEKKSWISKLKKFCSRRLLCGLACGVLKLILSMFFLAQIIALRYDEVFANKQIYLLLARISMAGNSFTTNLVIFRWLMTASMCLLLLDSIYSFLTIYKESKILHALNIVFCVLGISFVLSNLGFWIAVDVEKFSSELFSLSSAKYNFYSRLSDGYLMDEDGAWNNLFVKLKCCGYNYGNASDFPNHIILQDGASERSYNHYSDYKTPLFCCYYNPLTQTYNSDFSTCTSPGGSYYRYSEPCYLKLSERLKERYSISFYAVSSLACLLEILTIIVLSRLIKSDLSLKEDPILLKMRVHPTTRRKLKNASEEQRNENQDTSVVEGKEIYELSQISTTDNLNGTVLEENQDGQSAKRENKKKKRGGKVKPLSDIPDPVQRPLSKLPPLQMQRKP